MSESNYLPKKEEPVKEEPKAEEKTSVATPAVAEKKAPKVKVKPKTKPKAKAKKAKKMKIVLKGSLPKNNKIKLSNLIFPAHWNRDKLGDISGLVASIKSQGQLIPILIRLSEKAGVFYIVDGRRRFAALQKIGAATALVTFSIARDDKTGFRESSTANQNKKDLTPYERARSWDILVNVYGNSNEQIAKDNACTPGYVSQHLAVMKADKALQEALKKETIPLSVFRHFSKIDIETDSKIYAKLVEKTLAGAATQAIGDAVDAYITHKEKKAAFAKGDKTKPAKRGGAAHKAKKNKPKLDIQDYRKPEVQQAVKMVPKKDAIDWLDTYRDKALEATTARKRDYYQGALEGMEIMTGLLVED